MPLKPNVLEDLGRDVSTRFNLSRQFAQCFEAFATSATT